MLASLDRVVATLRNLSAFVRGLPDNDSRLVALDACNLARARGHNLEEVWMAGARVHSLLREFGFRADEQRSYDDMLTALMQAARWDFEHQ
ncbi:MAG TPA: hypothetical protein VKT83_01170 [bacterium]|nr:hypothetical protein [bacterium]